MLAFEEVEPAGLADGAGVFGFCAFSSSGLLNRLDLLNMDMAFPQMTIRRGDRPSVSFSQRLWQLGELTEVQV